MQTYANQMQYIPVKTLRVTNRNEIPVANPLAKLPHDPKKPPINKVILKPHLLIKIPATVPTIERNFTLYTYEIEQNFGCFLTKSIILNFKLYSTKNQVNYITENFIQSTEVICLPCLVGTLQFILPFVSLVVFWVIFK